MDTFEIGNRIKEARERKNMTMQDVADIVGIARSTVQRYEAGTIKKIKLPVIQAIANSLGVNPAWIVGKSDIQTVVIESVVQPQLSKDEEEHIKKYRTLDEYGKKNVDNVLDNEYTRCRDSKIKVLFEDPGKYTIHTLAAHEKPGSTEEDRQHDYDMIKDIVSKKRSEKNE